MLKIHLFLKTYSFYRCLELCSNSFLVLQPGLAVFASRPGNNCYIASPQIFDSHWLSVFKSIKAKMYY